MKVCRVFIATIGISLTAAFTLEAATSHFSTPSFKTPSFGHQGLAHSDAPLSTKSTTPVATSSRANPNLYKLDRADELRYRNANFKSRCLGLEYRSEKSGTQNDRFPNMMMKFENPRLRSLDFNSAR